MLLNIKFDTHVTIETFKCDKFTDDYMLHLPKNYFLHASPKHRIHLKGKKKTYVMINNHFYLFIPSPLRRAVDAYVDHKFDNNPND